METIPRTTLHSHLSVWWARCFVVVVRGKYGIGWQKEWIFSRKHAALKCRRIAAVESVLGIDCHKLAIDKFVYIRRKPSCVVHDQSAGLFKNFSHVLRLLRVILRGSQLSLSLSFSLCSLTSAAFFRGPANAATTSRVTQRSAISFIDAKEEYCGEPRV